MALTKKELEELQRTLDNQGYTLISSSVSKLLLASPDPNNSTSAADPDSLLFQYPSLSLENWTDAEVSGALLLVKYKDSDSGSTVCLFQIYSLKDLSSVLFEYELYENLEYIESVPLLHVFEMEECVAGFAFTDPAVAKSFFSSVIKNIPTKAVVAPPSPPPTKKVAAAQNGKGHSSANNSKKHIEPDIILPPHPNNTRQGSFFFGGGSKKKKKDSKNKKVNIDDIGDIEFSEHKGHIGIAKDGGLDVRNLPIEWKSLFKEAGIRKKDLKDAEMAKEIFKTIQTAEMDLAYNKKSVNGVTPHEYSVEERRAFERYQMELKKYNETLQGNADSSVFDATASTVIGSGPTSPPAKPPRRTKANILEPVESLIPVSQQKPQMPPRATKTQKKVSTGKDASTADLSPLDELMSPSASSRKLPGAPDKSKNLNGSSRNVAVAKEKAVAPVAEEKKGQIILPTSNSKLMRKSKEVDESEKTKKPEKNHKSDFSFLSEEKDSSLKETAEEPVMLFPKKVVRGQTTMRKKVKEEEMENEEAIQRRQLEIIEQEKKKEAEIERLRAQIEKENELKRLQEEMARQKEEEKKAELEIKRIKEEMEMKRELALSAQREESKLKEQEIRRQQEELLKKKEEELASQKEAALQKEREIMSQQEEALRKKEEELLAQKEGEAKRELEILRLQQEIAEKRTAELLVQKQLENELELLRKQEEQMRKARNELEEQRQKEIELESLKRQQVEHEMVEMRRKEEENMVKKLKEMEQEKLRLQNEAEMMRKLKEEAEELKQLKQKEMEEEMEKRMKEMLEEQRKLKEEAEGLRELKEKIEKEKEMEEKLKENLGVELAKMKEMQLKEQKEKELLTKLKKEAEAEKEFLLHQKEMTAKQKAEAEEKIRLKEAEIREANLKFEETAQKLKLAEDRAKQLPPKPATGLNQPPVLPPLPPLLRKDKATIDLSLPPPPKQPTLLLPPPPPVPKDVKDSKGESAAEEKTGQPEKKPNLPLNPALLAGIKQGVALTKVKIDKKPIVPPGLSLMNELKKKQDEKKVLRPKGQNRQSVLRALSVRLGRLNLNNKEQANVLMETLQTTIMQRRHEMKGKLKPKHADDDSDSDWSLN